MAALIEAVERGDIKEAFALIRNGANVNYVHQKDDSYSALYVAAAKGATQPVYVLLYYGADVNFSTRSHNTVLHAAADRGSAEVVRILVSYGAYINATNDNLDTALHISAYRGHSQVCALLLSVGADMYLVNLRGKTAFEIAESRRHSDTVLAFIRHRQNSTNVARGCHTQELFSHRPHQMAKNNSNHTAPLAWHQDMPRTNTSLSGRPNISSARPQNNVTGITEGAPAEYSQTLRTSDSTRQVLTDISNDALGEEDCPCHTSGPDEHKSALISLPGEVSQSRFRQDSGSQRIGSWTSPLPNGVSSGVAFSTSSILPSDVSSHPSPHGEARITHNNFTSDDWDLLDDFQNRSVYDYPGRNDLTNNEPLPLCFSGNQSNDLGNRSADGIENERMKPRLARDSGARRKAINAVNHHYENVVFDGSLHQRNGVGVVPQISLAALCSDECDSGSAPSWSSHENQHFRESPPVIASNSQNSTHKSSSEDMEDSILKLVIELSQKDTIIEQLRAENATLRQGAASRTVAAEDEPINKVAELKDELETKEEEIKKCKFRNEKLKETNESQTEVIEQLKRDLQSLTMLLRSQPSLSSFEN